VIRVHVCDAELFIIGGRTPNSARVLVVISTTAINAGHLKEFESQSDSRTDRKSMMHALFLVTYTEDCEKNWRSWKSIGNTCDVEVYDNRPHDRQKEIVAQAEAIKPQVIVYIGAIEKYHRRPVLKSDILKRLRDIAPSIHICGDASDKPWWEWLMLYDAQECFSVQVSIDGSFDTPLADSDTGMIKLTPTDPSTFAPKYGNETCHSMTCVRSCQIVKSSSTVR
jgi:hypothetical protein